MKTKILYMGTPYFAANVLEKLLESDYEIIGVVTQPDRRVGRKGIITPSKVKEVALKNNLKIYQPNTIKDAYDDFKDLEFDLIITCAYGQFIPTKILNLAKVDTLNVHASLLPKYRGGAPIHYALLNGDNESGVSIMRMVKEMDAGPVFAKDSLNILKEDNLESLTNKLSNLGASLLLKTLPSIISKVLIPKPQNESLATFSPNIKREEEKIDWNRKTLEVFNQIRAFSPEPGAYSTLENNSIKFYSSEIVEYSGSEEVGSIIIKGERLLIKTLDGALSILEIQQAGKKKMDIGSFLRGQQKNLTGIVLK